MAIKKIRLKSVSMKDSLINELEILSSADHANIVKFYGFVHHALGVWLIMEYAGMGSLDNGMRMNLITILNKIFLHSYLRITTASL